MKSQLLKLIGIKLPHNSTQSPILKLQSDSKEDERYGKNSVKINMTHRRLLENSGDTSKDIQGRMTMDPVMKTPDQPLMANHDHQIQSGGTTSFIGAFL